MGRGGGNLIEFGVGLFGLFFPPCISVFWFAGRSLFPSKPVSVPSQSGQELVHESPH